MVEPPAVRPMVTVDARGLRCPWPVLRLARAMRTLPDGAIARLLADDPATAGEVNALAREHGWTVAVGAGHYDVST